MRRTKRGYHQRRPSLQSQGAPANNQSIALVILILICSLLYVLCRTFIFSTCYKTLIFSDVMTDWAPSSTCRLFRWTKSPAIIILIYESRFVFFNHFRLHLAKLLTFRFSNKLKIVQERAMESRWQMLATTPRPPLDWSTDAHCVVCTVVFNIQ